MSKGSLFLLPTSLGAEHPDQYAIPQLHELANRLRYHIVENEKTARRQLRKLSRELDLNTIELFTLNKRTAHEEVTTFLSPCEAGHDMGLMSEAGLPAVADPGAVIVKMAHERGIRVVPLTGPSSIMLTLMASGFNGQEFRFHGYLPKEQRERVAMIKRMEEEGMRRRVTQLFMDTPYRNPQVWKDVLDSCKAGTWVCVGVDLTMPSESIYSTTIEKWKKRRLDLNKRPCMFAIGCPVELGR